ncbi:TPA_asm: G [Artemisia alphacytorhabdovirus 2]|nr:TPA_asm: G [Artemisia alphacytorhabdovirus 2]
MGIYNATWLILALWVTSAHLGTSRRGATQSSISTTKKSIGPIVDCTGNMTDLGMELRNCYTKCEGYSEPKSGVSISIYSSNADGPLVTSCSKVKVSQEFTQTWSFSTIKGPPRREKLPVSKEECEAEIKSKCPTKICDHRASSELPEEYHYASSTTVSATVVELVSASSLLFLEEGKEYLSPIGTKLRFLSSDLGGLGLGNVYFWDKVESLKTCPHNEVGIYGCDEFDEGDELFYSCAGGGITVTPTVPKSNIHPEICPGILMSEEGFLFKVNQDKKPDSKTGRLAINVNPDQAETADTTYLRHKIQQVAKKLDSDLCYTQCEIMSLEARSNNKTEHLVRIGHDHYLAHINGSATKCTVLQGCRLSSPPLFCGGPSRVGLICAGSSRLWNPLHPYLELSTDCPRPSRIDKLTFTMGSTTYTVDDKLEIELPKTELHGIYQSEFMRYHNSRTIMTVDELNTLGDSWKAAKSKPPSIGRSDANRVILAPHVSIGSWIVSAFHGVKVMFRSIEAFVGILVICLTVYLSLTLTMKLIRGVNSIRTALGGDNQRTGRQMYVRAPTDDGTHTTWI